MNLPISFAGYAEWQHALSEIAARINIVWSTEHNSITGEHTIVNVSAGLTVPYGQAVVFETPNLAKSWRLRPRPTGELVFTSSRDAFGPSVGNDGWANLNAPTLVLNDRFDSSDPLQRSLSYGYGSGATERSVVMKASPPHITITDTADVVSLSMVAASGSKESVRFDGGGQAWSLGRDGADSHAFLISNNGALGTNTVVRIADSGAGEYGITALKFRPTQTASTDANTLDDYEEGSWTPGVAFGGGTTGLTYTTQVGRYVKIGKMVYCQGQFVLSDNGSSAGAMTITGLPFTSENTTNLVMVGTVGYYAGFAATVLGTPTLVENPNSTTLQVYQGGAAASVALTDVDTTNTSRLSIYVAYRATA